MSHRKAIIKAATILFAQKGFKSSSIADISRGAKVAEGTIFHHFKSKDDLYLRIFEEIRSRIVESVDKHIVDSDFDSGLEMVRGILGIYLYLSKEMADEFRLINGTYPMRFAVENEVCNKHLEAVHSLFINGLSKAIVRGIEDGSIREVNPEKHSVIIFAMVNGLVRFSLFDLLPAAAYYLEAIDSCCMILEKRR